MNINHYTILSVFLFTFFSYSHIHAMEDSIGYLKIKNLSGDTVRINVSHPTERDKAIERAQKLMNNPTSKHKKLKQKIMTPFYKHSLLKELKGGKKIKNDKSRETKVAYKSKIFITVHNENGKYSYAIKRDQEENCGNPFDVLSDPTINKVTIFLSENIQVPNTQNKRFLFSYIENGTEYYNNGCLYLTLQVNN